MLLGATSLITSLNTVAKGSKRAEGKRSAPGSAADFCQLLSDHGREVSEISPFFLFSLGQLERGELQSQQAPNSSKAAVLQKKDNLEGSQENK